MAIRLESPPVREPMVDKNGNITRNWARWLTLLHAKTGGSEATLPVSLGGTGQTSIVGIVAAQTATSTSGSTSSGSGTGSNAQSERKTFALNSPATNAAGDSMLTTCIWDTPFPDAGYTITFEYDDPTNGSVAISSTTANGFEATVTNLRNRQTAGSIDCIGVHP